jgi:hypothetical protein
MRDRLRAARLAGASTLAIFAAGILPATEASACDATPTIIGDPSTGYTVTSVSVNCAPADQADFFLTSFDAIFFDGIADNDIAYDGQAADIVTIGGGTISDANPLPPVLTVTDSNSEIYTLDASDTVFSTLGGDDQVEISAGDVLGGIEMGAGDDRFTMTGGNVSGSVLGDDATSVGNDVFVISGGTIGGSIFAGGGDDDVTISGTAQIGVTAGDSVGLEDGDDRFTMRGGTLAGAVSAGAGDDFLDISAGQVGGFVAGGAGNDTIGISATADIVAHVTAEDGNDAVNISGGAIGTFVDLGAGNDTVAMTGGSVGQFVYGNAGNDTMTFSGGTVGGDVGGGLGDDAIVVNGGAITGSVLTDDVGVAQGADSVDISSGSVGGYIATGGGNDIVTVSGTGQVGLAAGGTDSVALGDGDDQYTMTGGTLAGRVSGGTGADDIAISAGNVGTFVDGGAGDDTIDVSGTANIVGDVIGGAGVDAVTIAGGAVGGSVDLGAGADVVAVNAGRIGGDVNGGAGDDTIGLAGGSVQGSATGGAGNDEITVSGTAIVSQSVDGGDGDDTIDVSGTATVAGDVIGGAGVDAVTIAGGAIGGSVDLGAGADVVAVNAGTIGGDVNGGADDDTIGLAGGTVQGSATGGAGNDEITVSGTAVVNQSVAGGDGDDQIVVSAGTIAGSVLGNDGIDQVTIGGGAIGGSVDLGAGADTVAINAGTITGDVDGGDDDDAIGLAGGSVHGSVTGGIGNDVISVAGTAVVDQSVAGGAGNDQIGVSGGTIAGSVLGNGGLDTVTISGGTIGGAVDLGADADVLAMTAGTVAGNVDGGDGADVMSFSGGQVDGPVNGGAGNDQINVLGDAALGESVSGGAGDDQVVVSDGTIGGSIFGNAGEDRVTVSGGTITGGIDAESVTLLGGSVGGDITGLSDTTLVINAADLTLRNGVLFQGTDAVGTITGTNLAGAAGTQSQNFSGFQSLALDGAATLGFVTGTQQIDALSVLAGSTVFVSGQVNLQSQAGGSGNVTLTNATINMVNNDPTDVFNVGDIALDGATIAIDVNAEQNVSDLINAAGAFTAAGANTVFVNLVGTPQLAVSSVIAIAPVNGEVAPTGGDASPFFSVAGIPSTPGALFTYNVITGGDGGLYLLVSPIDPSAPLLPRVAVDSQPIETVTAAVYDILNDSVLSNFGLLVSANRPDGAPGFGIYASGQAARVNHDGFSISGGGFSGADGPSFTANDFSLAASLELNAAEYFGLDKSIGLDIGLFGGYASSSVDLDSTNLFPDVGDGDNKSIMVGGYGLYRSGTSYGLVSATGFFGNTDLNNGVLNSTGSYDTAGLAVTGSVGHVYQINENLRFDLRGGLLGVTFQGDSFEDSQGVSFGKSRISFGALKFEPGIFGLYPLENGKVFSPYLRLDIQQRFSYNNESSVQGTEFDFDDADFSGAIAGGFNYQISKITTLSAEARAKVSEDSTTYAGKIGLKARF